MSELTPEQKYYRTKRTLLLVSVAAIVIIVLVLLQKCNEGKSAQLAYDAIEQRLNNVVDDSTRIKGLLDDERKKTNDLEMAVAEMTANYIITRNELLRESKRSTQLAADYKNARAQRDTVESFIICDSMADENSKLVEWAQKAWRQAASIDSLRREQNKSLNSQIKILRGGYDSCLSAAAFSVKELPKIKPRQKMYIDGAVMVGAITGVGGGGSYLDLKGNKFSPKVSVTNMGTIYEFGYGRLLSFKRKYH